MNNYYVYQYTCPITLEPIYIGKGKNNRAFSHLKRTDRHPFTNRLKHILAKGLQPIISFLIKDIDNEFALLVEIEAIAKFGRRNIKTGTLLNLTDGGEGTSGREMSCDTKNKIGIQAKLRGIPIEAVKAAKKSNTGRTHTEQAKLNMSASHKGKKFTEGHKKAISAASRGRTWTDEQKQKQSARLTEQPNRAYTWLLIDPHGKLHSVKKISEFCSLYSLSYSILRYKAQQNDCTPVSKGLSAGWVVFGIKK